MNQQQTLEQAITLLQNLNPNPTNTVKEKIKNRISSIKNAYNNEIVDAEYFSLYDVEPTFFDAVRDLDDELGQYLFEQAINAVTNGGRYMEYAKDLYAVEEIIAHVDEVTSAYTRAFREVKKLEEFLD